MAPNWARATRPLVLFFALVALVVTYIFKADVDAQGGAYATGVLVLMSSAAFAVLLSIPKQDWRARIMYLLITLVFAYTTVMNVVQRPEGLHIAAFFILTIFIISFISRAIRSTELRTRNVNFDDDASQIIDRFHGTTMFLVAHAPGVHDYVVCAQQARDRHYLQDSTFVFLEVMVGDASEFSEEELSVHGAEEAGFGILRCTSAAVPNAVATILLALRNKTGEVPHAFMYWTEGNPIFYVVRYLFLGDGETAPMTREILREAEHDPKRRPKLHVV
jgi:hypothetical protein